MTTMKQILLIDDDAGVACKLGASLALAKPFSPSELLDAVACVLARYAEDEPADATVDEGAQATAAATPLTAH